LNSLKWLSSSGFIEEEFIFVRRPSLARRKLKGMMKL
jgi:hypothetical protein